MLLSARTRMQVYNGQMQLPVSVGRLSIATGPPVQVGDVAV